MLEVTNSCVLYRQLRVVRIHPRKYTCSYAEDSRWSSKDPPKKARMWRKHHMCPKRYKKYLEYHLQNKTSMQSRFANLHILTVVNVFANVYDR